ncbi:MAG: hypothetical protein AAF416_18705 [Pseudomonadota bacterium]
MEFASDARDAETILKNPFAAISRPLVLSETGSPIRTIERYLSGDLRSLNKEDEVRFKSICNDPMFVIGGYNFIVQAGILSRYLEHDVTRSDAAQLIKGRGWEKAMRPVISRGRDAERRELFGKVGVRNFFKYAPPTDKAFDKKKRRIAHTREFTLGQRINHCIRLRKAIEFILLVESTLSYRFTRKNKAYGRVARFLCIDEERLRSIQPELLACYVTWNFLWIEPVHYLLSTPPREADIDIMMSDREAVADFTRLTKQGPGALYFILHGAVGSFRTVAAAATFVTQKYPDLHPCFVTTCPAGEYKKLLRSAIPTDQRAPYQDPERIVSGGPEFVEDALVS